MVTKVSEVKEIVMKGIKDPKTVFPKIKKMAESRDWQVREVSATVLVEISKKKTEEVIQEMVKWSANINPHIRRASCECLRDVARKNPNKVLPVIEKLKADNEHYVKKSVANILRNASKSNPEFVLMVCNKWVTLKNPNTHWIIKNGLIKLKESHSEEVNAILNLLGN